jgi:hypothetical protein
MPRGIDRCKSFFGGRDIVEGVNEIGITHDYLLGQQALVTPQPSLIV